MFYKLNKINETAGHTESHWGSLGLTGCHLINKTLMSTKNHLAREARYINKTQLWLIWTCDKVTTIEKKHPFNIEFNDEV